MAFLEVLMSDFWKITLSLIIVGTYLGAVFAVSWYAGVLMIKYLWSKVT